MKVFESILKEEQWKLRLSELDDRVSGKLNLYLEERSAGKKQPVIDFLFEYYSFRPSQLRRWSPGLRYALDAPVPEDLPELPVRWLKGEQGWILDASEFPEKRNRSLKWTLDLLESSRDAKPNIGCNGMHEWAMVYNTDKPRHMQLPFRLETHEINSFVETYPIRCTHFDAFRFFTEAAVPLNRYQPSRTAMALFEQPACLHTNMDLYKWAYKFYPFVSSELIWDCFELACEVRELDMQASPYDVREFGLEPVCIETESGREIYRMRQTEFYERSKPLRKRLIEELEMLAFHVSNRVLAG